MKINELKKELKNKGYTGKIELERTDEDKGYHGHLHKEWISASITKKYVYLGDDKKHKFSSFNSNINFDELIKTLEMTSDEEEERGKTYAELYLKGFRKQELLNTIKELNIKCDIATKERDIKNYNYYYNQKLEAYDKLDALKKK